MQNRLFPILALLAFLISPLHGEDETSALPIHLKTRGSTKNPSSLVLMISSTSDSPLTLQIHAASVDGKNQKDFSFDFPPHGKRAIGSQQGWPGAAGDIFTIQCSGYADLTYTLQPPKKSSRVNDDIDAFGTPDTNYPAASPPGH